MLVRDDSRKGANVKRSVMNDIFIMRNGAPFVNSDFHLNKKSKKSHLWPCVRLMVKKCVLDMQIDPLNAIRFNGFKQRDNETTSH